MSNHRRSRSRGHDRDSVPGDFDSIDPQTYFGPLGRPEHDRKTLQLCRQIARAISLALAGECHDELLRDVLVDRVVPAPDASRVLVTVIPTHARVDASEVLERLSAKKPVLRYAIAQAIHRKRAPELSFALALPPEVER